jgi:hypothetical protein
MVSAPSGRSSAGRREGLVALVPALEEQGAALGGAAILVAPDPLEIVAELIEAALEVVEVPGDREGGAQLAGAGHEFGLGAGVSIDAGEGHDPLGGASDGEAHRAEEAAGEGAAAAVLAIAGAGGAAPSVAEGDGAVALEHGGEALVGIDVEVGAVVLADEIVAAELGLGDHRGAGAEARRRRPLGRRDRRGREHLLGLGRISGLELAELAGRRGRCEGRRGAARRADEGRAEGQRGEQEAAGGAAPDPRARHVAQDSCKKVA